MDIFIGTLIFLIIFCSALQYYTRTVNTKVKDANFSKFQNNYLIVYMLAMLGDWLQGPHVYVLYESYNMTKHEIEILFIAGFGSSMLFGTIIGSFADKYGRRFNCILYGVLYGLGCITKHFNNFYILMFGRLLAGISTSILYSAFESWLIYEHKNRGFDESTLGEVFANSYFGNSVVAILAGVIAQIVANSFGYVAPFDTALLVFIIMVAYIVYNWSENYGDANAQIKQSFITAYESIKSDRKVLLLGLIQSLFEGSMYVFVLEWTPALTIDKNSSNPSIPHGYIFAAYMVAVMIGSNSFKFLIKNQSVEKFMRIILFLSALTLAVPVIFPKNQFLIFIAFIIFEMCVGIFWPSMGTLRSQLVPETARSTIMNFFRIPLNCIVVLILLQDISLSLIFKFCVLFLILATLSMFYLEKLISSNEKSKSPIPISESKQSLILDDSQ